MTTVNEQVLEMDPAERDLQLIKVLKAFPQMVEALRWVAGEDDDCPTELDIGVHTAMLAKVAAALRVGGQPSKTLEAALARVVAHQFIYTIREWLSPSDVQIAVERNRSETGNVCHTHDFCDANMAMQEAFGCNHLTTPAELSERGESHPDYVFATDLWNEAWKMAKVAEFNAEKLNP
jgi:hypothetical protein